MPDLQKQDNPRSELLTKLLASDPSTRHYLGHYIGPMDDINNAKPPDLLTALGIKKALLSPTALGALESVEELAMEIPEDWERFLWCLTAFVHMQDLFECPLQDGDDIFSIFQQYYFFYESKSILIECILAWLDGLYIASNTLLRPFLEFSLYQNYYIRTIRDGSTYKPLEKYFKDQIHPGQSKAIRHALPNENFCRPIRFRINAHLNALSNISQHVYHPDASTFQHRSQTTKHSIEGLFFWKDIHMILECALWVYYANTPTAFFPIDVMRKFAFNGPIGIFADHWTAKIIQNSLSPTDYLSFKEFAEPQARDTIAWGQSHPDLSDIEIVRTWDSQNYGPCPTNLISAYYTHLARSRSTRAALAFRVTQNAPSISPRTLELLGNLAGWSTLAKRGNKI